MLCFLVIESLDVVHGQNTDGKFLSSMFVCSDIIIPELLVDPNVLEICFS